MIPKHEIIELATQASLQTHVIEKDYVLGWLLAGINQHTAIHDTWVFKGGTCLKKCYFETYRFSEDLDFTLCDPSHINANFLLATFTEITRWTGRAMMTAAEIICRACFLVPHSPLLTTSG